MFQANQAQHRLLAQIATCMHKFSGRVKMAKQLINLGTSANSGDGDPLRTAFDKINDNFNELYDANVSDPSAIASTLAPSSDGTRDLGAADKRWGDLYVKDFIYLNGTRLSIDSGGNLNIGGTVQQKYDVVASVFADDSTLLVDGVNGKIVGATEPSSLLFPQLSQDEIDALTPEFGTVVYNTTTGKFQGYAADSDGASTAGWADLH